ncbi:hypothetical protein EVAR_23671_1 [Eumeta japonica]|uniref:Uncharacterized protein n=1 Tax=Eumeta variegata TaxID=151549 RepID=A0A4C1VL48_EUMVA|nr:hypothetical protein EVAR_23671_1 [Eumeta japonica]
MRTRWPRLLQLNQTHTFRWSFFTGHIKADGALSKHVTRLIDDEFGRNEGVVGPRRRKMVNFYALASYTHKVAASAIEFRSVNESSGGPLPFH